jgi:hypothetical protein
MLSTAKGTSRTSRDHEFVRAQKKVSKGHPKTLPRSRSVITDPRLYCEVICDHALNQNGVSIFMWVNTHDNIEYNNGCERSECHGLSVLC